MTQSEKWRTLARVLAVTVPLGSLIGLGLGRLIGGSGSATAAGALIGFLVTAGIVSFDVSWAIELIPRRWREARFLVVITSRSLVWLAVIVLGISVPLLTIGGLNYEELVDQQFKIAVGLSFVAALLSNFIAQVDRLLGRGVLIRLMLGRYHRPREENRVFLLIDLRQSTQIAEQLGNLRYHTFLKRFIADVTAPVNRLGGEVHRYVGDEVILTWTAEKGLEDAKSIRAVFAISDALEAAQSEYLSEFGVAPTFWAGLHVGQVVAGEIGSIKHEIAFLGDTLNTAARIEEACKQLERQFLASGDVVSAVELPEGITAESVGRIELRGVEEPLELFALSRAAESSKDGG